ncbi:hypothetical protein C5167_036840 [Papaver somniferum]|uniref:Uncharacterized protein n=1 Tax=Papaver somniferum TaxID=3469 RepID=A0A4Y7I8T7_PAPSO|nr:hypothetical protein C5167_036840 [Papaver somniferum]
MMPVAAAAPAKEQVAGVGATNAAAEASQWSSLISIALGLSPLKTESESSQLSRRDKRTTVESEDFRRRLVQVEKLSKLARSLEVSNMLNRSILDENRTLSDDVRSLKNNKLSFDGAYYRLSRDRNLLESSLQSQKDVSNDLASKLARLSKEKDEAC